MRQSITIEQAKTLYVHRFTAEHVPLWARAQAPNGKYYAPQYASDVEWFANTLFPPNNPFHRRDCYSTGQTWPFGKWLDAPFVARR